MKKKMMILSVLLVSIAYSRDIPEWERLGLSITEWNLIESHNLPIKRVYYLLETGIGITEYFLRPWEDLNITEDEWIAYRRSGLTDAQIVIKLHPMPVVVDEPGIDAVKLDKQDYSKLQSFFLPGYLQMKSDRIVLGGFQCGIAVAGLTGSIVYREKKKNAVYIPVAVLTTVLPAMLWSYLTR